MEVVKDIDWTPEQLFEKWFTVGHKTSGLIEVTITAVYPQKLTADGKIIYDADSVFPIGEYVTFEHNGDDGWLMTSIDEPDGVNVYVGEAYGGISIGN
jgi:hypothetical protein